MDHEIEVNGVKYRRIIESVDGRKIVRTRDAGVFFGIVESRDGDECVMRDARRLWYWKGASSLSELAMVGTSCPEDCKFPHVVDRVVLLGVIEILTVTETAALSIDGVEPWTQH